MKQQAQWLLCVVCALGVSGVALGDGGSDSSGGKLKSDAESILRQRKGYKRLSDQESSDGDVSPASEEDDKDGSVPEARPSRLLSTTVSVGERIFNALIPGYGSRMVAEGMRERADQVEDKAVRDRMHELAAQKYLDEAEVCRRAGKPKREKGALVRFINSVKQIGDEKVRTQLCVLAVQTYLEEAIDCFEAEEFEREKEALHYVEYLVEQVGDGEEAQDQLYESATQKYLEAAAEAFEREEKEFLCVESLVVRIEDRKERDRMYKLFAQICLEKAVAEEFEREERALSNFVCLVERMVDGKERGRMYESAVEGYLKKVETHREAGEFEREKEALVNATVFIKRIGDREKQDQIYKSTAEKYFNEAKACAETGDSRRKMEALENYAYVLIRQAVFSMSGNSEEELNLYKGAAAVLDELAKQDHECSTLRAYAHYDAGLVGVELARDKAKEGGGAAEESLLERAIKDLESAEKLFTEVKEAELIEKASKLLREAEAELSDLNKRLEAEAELFDLNKRFEDEAERKRLEEAKVLNECLAEGKDFVDQADMATSDKEKRALLRRAIETFQEGCTLCSDRGEYKQLKIGLWREIAYASRQYGLYVTSKEDRCRALHRAAKYFNEIVDNEKNPISVAEAAAETSYTFSLQSWYTEPDKKESLTKKAAELGKKALENLLDNLGLLSGDVSRDNVNRISNILDRVKFILSLYEPPLLAQSEIFELANLLTELLSKGEVRQCITQRLLKESYGILASYFGGVAQCKKMGNEVCAKANRKANECRSQVAIIEAVLRADAEDEVSLDSEESAKDEVSSDSEESDEDEEIFMGDMGKDTNSSKKVKDAPLSSSATPPVVSVSK